jgi:hypothetical protein
MRANCCYSDAGFETAHVRQEELPEETFIESAPPMQSRLIWAVRQPVTH